MGVEYGNDKKITFIGISQGELRIKADENTEGAKKRDKINKKGEKIGESWYIIPRGITGHIHSVDVFKNDHINSDVLRLNLYDPKTPDELVQLQMRIDSRYIKDLLNRLVSDELDYSKPIRIYAKDSEGDNGRVFHNCVVCQKEDPASSDWRILIKGLYNKSNADTRAPEWKESYRKDEEELKVWQIKMKKYNKMLVTEDIKPRIVQAPSELPVSGKNPITEKDYKDKPENQSDDFLGGDDTDDLPF